MSLSVIGPYQEVIVSIRTVVSAAGLAAIAAVVSLPLAAQETRSPAQIDQSVNNGSDLFRRYCASCHGATARGDGPLADAMRRRPPNLTELRKRNPTAYSSDLVYRIIDGREKVRGHGGPDMPVWGDAFSRSLEGSSEDAIRARIQGLVDFLESIQVKDLP
jgi:mono/diheme cytochrome c family protein